MKFAKRVLVLGAILSLGAAGACSSGPGSAGGDGGDGAVTVAATSNEKPALDAAVAAYEEAHPDAEIQVTYAALDQYQTTIRTQLSSGTAPDVLFVWPGNGNPVAMEVAAGAGYLEDLSGRPWAEQISEGIKPVARRDGKTWIAPVGFSGIGAVYNTTALDAAGLAVPETWTELLDFCAAAKREGKVAFSLGAQTPWVTQLTSYALTPTLVYGPNPEFAQQMANGEATFADSAWQSALNKYVEMQERGCFNESPLGTSYESSLTQVAKGDALGVVQVNSAVPALKEQAGDDVSFDLRPLPATDDPAETRMAGAAGSSYGVNAAAEHKDGALEFVDWLMSAEGMNLYAETNAALPSIPNDQFTVDPALTTLQRYQEEGKTFPYMDQQWPNARVQQAHFTAVQELLGGRTTPADALRRMDEAYQQGA
ncbi:ABC transporter substrate-binding protein [Qaidamihabitans albus]|uniref:ABC transporter substrate-binding protein n=1 Tax=Qaidamihabitans albus TaxID=2795733 RepID=UPI0018F14BB4|nr:extracellular solute-binding protein [Qaidamihabitans albus]